MEIWKTIEGTENHYEVSNLGNFKLDGKPIDTVIDSTGYVKVRIAFPIGTRWFWVHRIVAVYFCERFNDKNQVNHIDGVKTNNKSNNLEWCTNTENQKHRINVLGKDCKGTNNPMYGMSCEKSPVFKGYINQIDPPLKPGEFRNPNIPVEKIMSIRVEVFGNVLEYTVPANATSVKDGDTEIYLRRDDLETKLKSQVDSYRIMFESVNKQKQLYEKYNDLFQSVKGNSQENVTEEKYKELIARIAELEEQLKEKQQPKE